MSEKEQKEFNFIKVLKFFIRWRYPIIVISFLAAVAGIIFSGPYFITPLYQSEAKFYAGITQSTAYTLLERTEITREDYLEFGEETEAEQFIQILESDYVMEQMIDKFDLYHRYGIDPDSDLARTEMEDIYRSRTGFSRTPYASVVVISRDADPDVAADMANTLMYMVDTVKDNIQRDRASDAYRIIENEYRQKQKEVRKLVDSLNNFSNNEAGWTTSTGAGADEILNAMHQLTSEAGGEKFSNNVMEAIYNKVSHNTPANFQNRAVRSGSVQPSPLQDGYLLHHYGPKFYALANQLSMEVEGLAYLKERKEHARVDAEERLTDIYVIDEARPQEKDVYPVRTIIVISSFLAALLFSSIAFLFVENFRHIRQFIKESS